MNRKEPPEGLLSGPHSKTKTAVLAMPTYRKQWAEVALYDFERFRVCCVIDGSRHGLRRGPRCVQKQVDYHPWSTHFFLLFLDMRFNFVASHAIGAKDTQKDSSAVPRSFFFIHRPTDQRLASCDRG